MKTDQISLSDVVIMKQFTKNSLASVNAANPNKYELSLTSIDINLH